jgi:hypothetical protein
MVDYRIRSVAAERGAEKWFQLGFDLDTEKRGVILDGANHDDFSEWDFLSGKEIQDWPGDAAMWKVEKRGGRRLHDYLMSFLPHVPVVSARAADCFLERFGADIQLLPVKVSVFGAPEGKWFILHSTKLLSALDTERSTMRSGIATTIVIKEEAVPSGVKLFRLREQSTSLIVHRDVKEMVMLEGLTGFGFWEL